MMTLPIDFPLTAQLPDRQHAIPLTVQSTQSDSGNESKSTGMQDTGGLVGGIFVISQL